MQDIVERITSIRINYNQGKRAPHKPLLILMALGKLRNTGRSLMAWSEVEPALTDLLNQYGNNSSPKPLYPFTLLPNDGFWHLDKEFRGESVKELRELNPSGRFDSEIEEALISNEHQIFAAARTLIDEHFSYAYAAELLIECGLDPDEVLAAPVIRNVELRQKRDPRWRKQILEVWNYSCAFCGFDAKLSGQPLALEAAHIRWFSFQGPDVLENGLALCAVHHNLLDRGAIGFQSESKLKVSEKMNSENSMGVALTNLHDFDITARGIGTAPKPEYVEWHDANIFHA